ncbi:MAG: purine-binding chemotaxis protein CheW [Candidatus Rokubacteria bacterium]|nr:purine-binding chemotaxis protein CheW [Candidatus Rokubacteria bacterium]
MSRLDLVAFVIDGQRYALALGAVERVLPMVAVSPLPRAPAIALGVINVHGTIVPVVDVRRRFGLPARDFGVTTRLVIARAGRRTLAVPADEVLGVVEVAAESVVPPEALLPGIGHVAGVVALPDGLMFIHDLDAFLSPDEERRLSEALDGSGA